MKRNLIVAAALAIPLLASCGGKPEEEPKGKAAALTSPRLVGRIASIPAERNFALIQAYGTWETETGTILTTQGPEGRTANLKVTGEKLGQYAAADIQSGTLEIGDGVYTLAKTPEPAVETPEPEGETEQEAALPEEPR